MAFLKYPAVKNALLNLVFPFFFDQVNQKILFLLYKIKIFTNKI